MLGANKVYTDNDVEKIILYSNHSHYYCWL